MSTVHTTLAILTALALALLALAWRDGGAIRFARWRALRRHLRAARRQAPPANGPSVTAAIQDADLPDLPMTDLPRFLMIGDGAVALSALLSSASNDSPSALLAADDPPPFWRGWTLPAIVAIEVRPPPADLVGPVDTNWLTALQALARMNPKRPLDGMVLCVSTALLRADATVADPVMQLAARRVHQTASALRMRLPIQLLVTGLQDLPGYDCVRAALPDALAAHALGWRPGPGQHQPSFDEITQPIGAALHALRLGLLATSRDIRQRHDIHRFVEAVIALEPGLRRLHATLKLEGDTRTPWQGLYLTASGPHGAFVHELFAHFIPAAGAAARDMP